jgi:hypothetical protein
MSRVSPMAPLRVGPIPVGVEPVRAASGPRGSHVLLPQHLTPRAASRTTAPHGPDLLGRWARQARTRPMPSEWGPDPIIASVRER